VKIVIDIDNDTCNNIVKDFPEMFWSYNIRQSIKNGILQNPDCRLIDAEMLNERMYRAVFEEDTDLVRNKSGVWLRYKLFEQVLSEIPTVE